MVEKRVVHLVEVMAENAAVQMAAAKDVQKDLISVASSVWMMAPHLVIKSAAEMVDK